jgi:hypothetical protein
MGVLCGEISPIGNQKKGGGGVWLVQRIILGKIPPKSPYFKGNKKEVEIFHYI